MISVLRSGRAPLPRACNPLHLQFRVPPSGPPSPDQPDDAGGRMGAGRASLPGMLFGVAIAALVTAAATASAIDPPADRSPGVAAAPLPQKLRQDALRGKVRHAEVRAPLGGTVSAVHVKTVGAVVQAGTMLVEIVPAEAEYLVRAQVLPQNVKDVQPGQIARISLAAYDPSRYGVITAGMPLQVDILGGKRTIMNYIMTPIQKSLATAFREK